MEIAKKTAIITGASSGLGEGALASALVVKDTKVYDLARNAEKRNSIQNGLGTAFIPVVMDITDQTHFFDDSGILPNPTYLQPKDIATLIVNILETPDNFLVDEITLRPLIEHPTA